MIRAPSTRIATAATTLLVLALSSLSSVRGDVIKQCNMNIINYSNAPIDLNLCDGRDFSCATSVGFYYEIPAAVNGKPGEVLDAYCLDPSSCTLQLGNDDSQDEQIDCNSYIVFHVDGTGTLKNCYGAGGPCYAPPPAHNRREEEEELDLGADATPPRHLQQSQLRGGAR